MDKNGNGKPHSVIIQPNLWGQPQRLGPWKEMVREYLVEQPDATPRQIVAYVWAEMPDVEEMVNAIRAAPSTDAALAVLVEYFTDPARDIPAPDTLARRAREVRQGK